MEAKEEFYYGADEIYMAAKDLVFNEEYSQAKLRLEDILADDPAYAKAHYLLGRVYYHGLSDYSKAERHFALCVELDSSFPDVYKYYLKVLLVTGQYDKLAAVADQALTIAGVCRSCVLNQLGMMHEKKLELKDAELKYRKALLYALTEDCTDDADLNLERISNKQKAFQRFNYESVTRA